MANILVIEDNAEIRAVVKTMLQKQGHEVREALDGEEGIDMFRACAADLVITDLFMPKKAGIETISDLQEIDPGVRVIAMTAHGTEEQFDFLRVAEALGAVRTLEKPFLSEDLITAVSEVLKK